MGQWAEVPNTTGKGEYYGRKCLPCNGPSTTSPNRQLFIRSCMCTWFQNMCEQCTKT